MAEREGFEPSGPCGPPVFKTGAFVRSATAPLGIVGGTPYGGCVRCSSHLERCRSLVDRASLLRR